jgi:hypothetical protein
MTDDRSLERAARSWIETGPIRAPDSAVERALLTIETTPQERDLRVLRRFHPMTFPARIAAAVLVGVVAIGAAAFLMGRTGQSNVGGPAASVSPSASASAAASLAASSSSSGPLALPEGALAAGTYVATPFAPGRLDSCLRPPQPGCSESEDDSIRATFTVPDGWAGSGGGTVWLAAESSSAPGGAVMDFGRGGWLHSDPCLTAEQLAANVTPDVAVGPSVDELATAIADHPLLEATDPVAVTLGGYSGKYVDLQLPTDLTGCTESYYPWEPGPYAQGPSNRWQLWILDVNGVRVVIQTMDYPGTSEQHRDELRAIVESIQIEP